MLPYTYNRKLVFMALLLSAGLVLAIGQAQTVTWLAEGKYDPAAANSDVTEGGNVTNLDISGNVSTEKWAGYWGNVSAALMLSPNDDNTAIFYSWAWTPVTGGEVCAVAASSGFSWAAVQNVSAAEVDTVWGFTGGDIDSAASTLGETCAVTVAGTSVSGSAGETTGGSAFQSCAVADTATPAAKSDLAFCVNITAGGSLFNGQDGDYQLLVPTDETDGNTETYYFWVELS
ncbi:MAG: hypothetical protein AB1295_00145 [Candidatus Micrarchaeota archaeon]